MIVSGGASGLGIAAAKKFAKNGYNIVIIDINEEKGKIAEKQIKDMGQDAVFCLCDISNKEQVQQAAKVTKEKFGNADVLINNAGLEVRGSILQCLEEDWVRLYDINLRGIYYMSNAFVPFMIHQGAGAIINTGSILRLSHSRRKGGLFILKGCYRYLNPQHGI